MDRSKGSLEIEEGHEEMQRLGSSKINCQEERLCSSLGAWRYVSTQYEELRRK